MPKVSNLIIKLQTGTDGTYYASWDFKEDVKNDTSKPSSSSSIKPGVLVTIKSGAKYYNGVSMPSWVMSDKWKVVQVSGDRAVLGKNASGTHDIQSPVNVKYLTLAKSKTATPAADSIVKTLDHYSVHWYYDSGNGVWFDGGSSDVKLKNATYNPPSNAIRIKVNVKPVSKTHKVNDKDVHYWTGTTVTKLLTLSGAPPEKPSAPTVTIEKYRLRAAIENISDPRTDKIQFEIYKGTKKLTYASVKVITARATYSCNISVGEDYRVRARAININGSSKIYSEWSDFSSNAATIPKTVTKFEYLKALSTTSIGMRWGHADGATGYDVEYTTKKEYFGSSSEVKTISVTGYRHVEITGLESGKQYFLRVRAKNSNGESGWSEIQSITIGKKPAAPTTWSSSTTVIVGEPLTLYWLHNTEDGSSETKAELEIYVDGVKKSHVINKPTSEDEKDKTSFYKVDTSLYSEGTKIQWRVRTSGITNTYGDWSMQRTVDIYAPVTLALSLQTSASVEITTITGFPFYISAIPGPDTQSPIGYHLSITSNEQYETVDQVGNRKIVNNGETVYSKYFDIKDNLFAELLPSDVDLENNVEYTVKCSVSMNSGLTGEATSTFTVSWSDLLYEPDAEIGIDKLTYTAMIRPYCVNENNDPVTDVVLSVYRKNYDGTFTEIGNGIDSTRTEWITDPHPALDFARYRIVATSKSNGDVSYYDPPGYPVDGKTIVIQWDEEWSRFYTEIEDGMEDSNWAGSLLRLPYNVKVSDSNQSDVTFVNYIGRNHSVSYYGTQLGVKSTWNTEIPKDDKETLYALRRLAIWMGDVYVREPSGSGYWANVNVSFSQEYSNMKIPVTLEITRVEGGI